MRVALLSRAAHPLHAPGGLERAVYQLARHLRALGVETLLFTREATRAGVFPGEVVEVPYARWRFGRHGRVLDRTLHYPGFARRLGEAVAERVRQGQVDLVHAQGLTALGYARLRLREPALRAPLVMNPQGMEEHKARGLKRLALGRLRRLSCEAARLSDRVIATDQATREEVPRLLGVAPERVVVLPNGVDAAEIASATPADPAAVVDRAFPLLAGAFPLFLSVGRLEAYKGFGDVLEALELLAGREALPPRAAWVLVGHGPQARALERRAAADSMIQRGAGRRFPDVVFAGQVEESLLHALFARADVFVHATRYEGSSLVTLEAMAHGLPVVATRAGGIPDKIVDGETGCLLEPGDVAGLAERLALLAGDAALRRELGERGRARALARFSWASIARDTLALYRELLEGRA